MHGSIKHKLKTKFINLKLIWWFVKNTLKHKLEKWVQDSNYAGALEVAKQDQHSLDVLKKNIEELKEKNKFLEARIKKY